MSAFFQTDLPRARRGWLPIVLTGGCWTFVFVTAWLVGSDGFFKPEKVLKGFAVLPVFLLAAFFLYTRGVQPALTGKPRRETLRWLWLALALGAFGMLVFPPSMPLFDVNHSLRISPEPGKTVEIRELRRHNETLVQPAEVRLTGQWEVSGSALLSSPGSSATLDWQETQQGGLVIEFRMNQQSGLTDVWWDGSHQQVDLYGVRDTVQHVALPGFSWGSLSPLQAALAVLMVLLNWLGLTALVFAGLALFSRRDLPVGEALPMLLIMGAAIYLSASAFQPAAVREFVDSMDYNGQGMLVVDGQVVCCRRPFVVPLLYGLLANSNRYITGFQLAFSLAAWGFLGCAASRPILKRGLRLFTFALVLVFSLSASITQWQKEILSDSISFSTFALMTGFWLLYLRKPGWWKLGGLGLATLLWSSSRFTNTYSVLAATLAVGLALLLRRSLRRRIHLALLGALVLVLAVGMVDFNLSRGWVPPYAHVLMQRILPSPEATEFFQRAGMPVGPELMSLTGEDWESANDWAFYKSPALADFRAWLYPNGTRTLAAYLLSNPQALFIEPWDYRNFLLEGWQASNRYAPAGYLPPLGNWLNLADMPLKVEPLGLWLVFALACTGYAWVRRRSFDRRWWLPLVMIALVLPQLLLVYHGDSMDIRRHALASGVQLRLGLLLLLATVMDTPDKESPTSVLPAED